MSQSGSSRSTGSWVVRTRIGYLTGIEGSGVTYGSAADALVFPTKTAAKAAMRGVLPRGEVAAYERSRLHEEHVHRSEVRP